MVYKLAEMIPFMDYYLEDLSRLNGQPKKTIGEYVESKGILVPRRFDTLAEAEASPLFYILRSEGAPEYTGPSGMFSSYKTFAVLIDKPVTEYTHLEEAEEAVRDCILRPSFIDARIDGYLESLAVSKEEFCRGFSFSIWQYMSGKNHTVVRDSCVPDRFHILSSLTNGKSYDVWEQGDISRRYASSSFLDEATISHLVSTYKGVHVLDHFNSDDCPIMEFQSTPNGYVYFLQTHPTRRFTPADHTLDRPTEKGEIEADFTRGALPEGGLDIDVVLTHQGFTSVSSSDGSFCPFDDAQKQLSGIFTYEGVRHIYEKVIANHMETANLFLPEVSVLVDPNSLFPEGYKEFYTSKVTPESMFPEITLHVESDGRRALIERV